MPFKESRFLSDHPTYTRSEIFEIIFNRYSMAEEYTGREENRATFHLMLLESLEKFGRERFPRQFDCVKKAIRFIADRHFNSLIKEYCARFLTYLGDSDSDSDSDDSV